MPSSARLAPLTRPRTATDGTGTFVAVLLVLIAIFLLLNAGRMLSPSMRGDTATAALRAQFGGQPLGQGDLGRSRTAALEALGFAVAPANNRPGADLVLTRRGGLFVASSAAMTDEALMVLRQVSAAADDLGVPLKRIAIGGRGTLPDALLADRLLGLAATAQALGATAAAAAVRVTPAAADQVEVVIGAPA